MRLSVQNKDPGVSQVLRTDGGEEGRDEGEEGVSGNLPVDIRSCRPSAKCSISPTPLVTFFFSLLNKISDKNKVRTGLF